MEEALDRFESNHQLWEKRNPRDAKKIRKNPSNPWQFVQTGRKNELNLLLNTDLGPFYLYSIQNIQVEVRQWAQLKPLHDVVGIVVYGVGLGYYYKELKAWLHQNKQRQLIFIEDSFDVMERFLSTDNATPLLEDPQVDILIHAQDADEEDFFVKLANTIIFQKVEFMSLISYETHKRQSLELIKFYYEYMRHGFQIYMWEYLDGGKDFFKNFYENLLRLDSSYFGNKLMQKFKNTPAIICGAGPSLAKNIGVLKELQDKALIIAGGTALNALNVQGINPHFGIGVDPFETYFTRTLASTAFEVPFFYKMRMNAQALDMVHAPLLYLAGGTSYRIESQLEKKLDLPSKAMSCGTNVVNFALSLAHELGCNPIITVGVDLAYPNDETYAPGIKRHAISTERLTTKLPIEDIIMRQDIYGNPVKTLWKWIQESIWYSEFQIAHPEIKIINSTEGGLGFSGIENIPLAQVKERFLTNTYDFTGKVHAEVESASMPLAVSKPTIYAFLRSLTEGLKELSEKLYQICKKDPQLALSKKFDEKQSEQIREILKGETYESLLQEFDEVFQKFVLSNENLDGSFKDILKDFESRLGFLQKTAAFSLKFIDKAVQKQISTLSKISSQDPPFTLPTDIQYSWQDNTLKIVDPALTLNVQKKFDKIETIKESGYEGYKYQGLLQGPSHYYNEEGTLLSESWYLDGQQIGRSNLYYPSGKLFAHLTYAKGKLNGEQKYFFEDSGTKASIHYTEGDLNGAVKLFFPNRHLFRQLAFSKNKRIGKDIIWYSSGRIWIESEYRDDYPLGIARTYYPDGALHREVYYGDQGKVSQVIVRDETGKIIPSEETKKQDYFEEASQKTDGLTNSLQALHKSLSSTFNVLQKEHLVKEEKELQKDIQDLGAEIEVLNRLSNALFMASGQHENTPEPIWKTQEVQGQMKQDLEQMTGRMNEACQQIDFQIQHLLQNIKDKETPQS